MLLTIFKKKLSDNQLANVFINGILELVENSFSEVVGMVNDDVAFPENPNIEVSNNGHFSLIVLAANLSNLESTFETDQADRVERIIFDKLAVMMNCSSEQAMEEIRDLQKFMGRINHPSKNLIYAMSKAFFFKYDLNQYQDEYFRRLSTPNPLFLKRLDAIMPEYLWDWDNFFKRYKIEE